MAACPAPIAPEILGLPSFPPDMEIATTEGLLPAAWIVRGHRVLTLDRGVVRVLRVEEAGVSDGALGRAEDVAAVLVPADALGPGAPAQATALPPGHLLAVAHPLAEFYFGSHRVLVEARHLVGLNGIAFGPPAAGAAGVHLVLASAALVEADGLASAALGPSGELPAYPVLEAWEVRLMAGALARPDVALRRTA